jgi:hypothetical protein
MTNYDFECSLDSLTTPKTIQPTQSAGGRSLGLKWKHQKLSALLVDRDAEMGLIDIISFDFQSAGWEKSGPGNCRGCLQPPPPGTFSCRGGNHSSSVNDEAFMIPHRLL